MKPMRMPSAWKTWSAMWSPPSASPTLIYSFRRTAGSDRLMAYDMTTDGYSNLMNGERHENGSRWFDRLAANLGFSSPVDSRRVIEEALKNADTHAFSSAERAMLQKTLAFKQLRVEDVMVRRAEIVAIEESANLGELLTVLAEGGHSRIPVYRDTLDEPLGMVHVKDLMGWAIAQGKNGLDGATMNLGAADLSKTIAEAGI